MREDSYGGRQSFAAAENRDDPGVSAIGTPSYARIWLLADAWMYGLMCLEGVSKVVKMADYNIMELAGAMLLHVAAAACIFMILLNRHLSKLRDSKAKALFVVVILLGVFVAFGLGGWLLPTRPWGYVPAAILALVAVGELERAVLRKVHAGSRPLDSIPHNVKLLKPFTTTDVVVHRYEIVLPDWRGDRLRICHLSDLHIGSGFERSYYDLVFGLAQESEPDLVFITGDFVSNIEGIDGIGGMNWPRGKAGTYACFGNHDYWTDVRRVKTAIDGGGVVRIVSGAAATVRVAGGNVGLVGWDYPWGDTKVAPEPPHDTDVVFLLSHTPDNIYRVGEKRMHCVFSGHLHAGQFRLPSLGPIVVPSSYGRRFDHGHFIVKGMHLFVTGGIGTVHFPLRLYCEPDIFIVDVRHA